MLAARVSSFCFCFAFSLAVASAVSAAPIVMEPGSVTFNSASLVDPGSLTLSLASGETTTNTLVFNLHAEPRTTDLFFIEWNRPDLNVLSVSAQTGTLDFLVVVAEPPFGGGEFGDVGGFVIEARGGAGDGSFEVVLDGLPGLATITHLDARSLLDLKGKSDQNLLAMVVEQRKLRFSSVVPEPSTALLTPVALLAVRARARRRRAA